MFLLKDATIEGICLLLSGLGRFHNVMIRIVTALAYELPRPMPISSLNMSTFAQLDQGINDRLTNMRVVQRWRGIPTLGRATSR